MRLPQLTFGKVLAGTAVVLVLTTGTAYAANTIASGDIINGEVKTQDLDTDSVTASKIAPGAVGSSDIATSAVKSGDIFNDTITTSDVKNATLTGTDVADGSLASADVLDDSLTADDLASNSVGQLEIQTDGVAATEISDNSIDSGEIQDFSLSNLDINVFSAQVNADGTLASASNPGTTSVRVGVVGNGTYQVDFARVISSCTFVASLGSSGTAGALGEVSVADRSGNSEAVFVETNTSAGGSADRPFQLVVVC